MVTIRKRWGLRVPLLLALLFCSIALLAGATAQPALAQGGLSIAGRVLSDVNNNLLIDAGDQPLVGVEVRLLNAAGTPLSSTVTDVQGAYLFDNVAAGGSYLITTVPPFASIPVKVVPGPGAIAAGTNTIFIRNFGTAASYPENNFLLRQFQVVSPVTPDTPNTVSGRVINDLNGNGAADVGEPGLGGAVLTLFNAAGVVLGTTTSAITGEFTFAGIPNGDFFLTETDPAGYSSTNAIAGVGGTRLDANTLRITTVSGVTQYAAQLFLDQATGSVPPPVPGPGTGPNMIEGYVLNDASGNGMVGRGDLPIAGAVVTLRDATGALLATTTSDVNGRFEFRNLATAVYLISETDPPGYISVDAAPGSAGVKIDENTIRISMIGGLGSYAGNVFLDRQVSVPPAGANLIAGSVFNDANGNGVIDAGEGPLANVSLTLRDVAGNPIAVTTTTVTGAFTFVGLASGTYTVTETDPPGYASVTALAGTGGQVLDPNNIRITTVDGIFTYAGHTFLDRGVTPPTPGPDSISGLVINDANGNGAADAGEAPLAGAVITLQDSTGQFIASAATGPDGTFSFGSLADGTYTLIELDPAGFSSTGAVAGVGGQVLDANTIRITTIPGLTSYPGQLFLDTSGGTPPSVTPSIIALSPGSGGPGSTVTISGRGFGGGAIQVMFGAVPGTILESSSLLNSIVALVPNVPAGPTQITLVNSTGASNAVPYTVTAPGLRSALAPLFLPAFTELGAQKNQLQVGPTMEVVIAQSLGFAQNQAVVGNLTGAMNTLQGLIVRIGRSGAPIVSTTAKAALAAAINALISQLQTAP